MELMRSFKRLFGKEETGEVVPKLVTVKDSESLSSQMSEAEASALEELKVSGNLDGEGLTFMHRKCKKLKRLDLSEAHLLGGRFICGKHKNFYDFAANELSGHTLHIGKLKEVVLPASVDSVVVSTFADIDFGKCSDGSELTRLSGAFGSELERIEVPATNPHYSSYDGILYNKDKTELIKCPISHSKEVKLPSTLKTVRANAFRECRNIESIEIPEGVTTIGEKAFYGCEMLYKLTLPSSITTLHNDVFAHSYKLETLECGSEKPVDLMLTRSSSVMKCRLIVPKASVEDYSGAPYWSEFKKIIGK